MDKQQKRLGSIALYLVTLMLLLRYFPKVGYGLVAITLLVMLFKLKKK
jgi:hypothetical protein